MLRGNKELPSLRNVYVKLLENNKDSQINKQIKKMPKLKKKTHKRKAYQNHPDRESNKTPRGDMGPQYRQHNIVKLQTNWS